MKKRLAILTRYPKEYEPQRLAQEAQTRGLLPFVFSYRQVRIDTQSRAKITLASHPLSYFHFFLPRSSAKKGESFVSQKTALLLSLSPNQICLNKKSFLLFPLLSKVVQMTVLAHHGLPVVPTVVQADPQEWSKLAQDPPFCFPCIVKAHFGSHGRQVWRVDNKETMARIGKNRQPASLLLQPLIKAPFWWRALVLGGRLLGVVRRKSKQRFLKKGEEEKSGNPDFGLLPRLITQASQLFALEFAGIDLFWSQKEKTWYFLEINRTPQFKVFEKQTGVNVASALIDYLVSQKAKTNG